MTSTARLDFVTVICRTLHDAGDLLGIFWKGDGNWGHWSVEIVHRRRSQVEEGVALENHEARAVTDCGEEAVLTGDAVSDSHFERSPRSHEGVDGVKVGFSDGEVFLNAKD